MEAQPLSELKTEFLFEVSVDLEEAQPIGSTLDGIRQIFYVKGGTVEGPKVKGEVLPGGGDWFLIRPDGAGETGCTWHVANRRRASHLFLLPRHPPHLPRGISARGQR